VIGPGVEISQIPHIVYFLEDEETLLKVPSMLPLLLGTIKSPRVPVNLENHQVTVLLDTGAEVSVISKTLMKKINWRRIETYSSWSDEIRPPIREP